jgi:hypothetical protein
MPGLPLSAEPPGSFPATVSLSLAASFVPSPLYTMSVTSARLPESRLSSLPSLLRALARSPERCYDYAMSEDGPLELDHGIVW